MTPDDATPYYQVAAVVGGVESARSAEIGITVSLSGRPSSLALVSRSSPTHVVAAPAVARKGHVAVTGASRAVVVRSHPAIHPARRVSQTLPRSPRPAAQHHVKIVGKPGLPGS